MFEITKGKKKDNAMIAIYGVEGIGKTTFASQLKGAVIVDIEKGSRNYDVNRVEGIDTWEKLSNFLYEVAKSAEDLKKAGVKTLVFDSVDYIENELLIPKLLKDTKAKTLAEMQWGKGYELEARAFSEFLQYCKVIKEKGFNICFIVHSTLKQIDPPDANPYSHYELKLNKKLCAMLKESVDMLLFFNFSTLVNGNKAKSVERVMITNHTAYADAKNRYGLETKLSMNPEIINEVLP